MSTERKDLLINHDTEVNVRFMVAGNQHWGCGESLAEANQNFKKAGGKGRVDKLQCFIFIASVPFAPYDRDATEQEADCWVTQDGCCHWVRCVRREM